MSVSASVARARLLPLIEMVNEDQVAIEIVSKRGTAWLVSEGEYNSLKETVYLLSSPASAQRLHDSLAEARRGESAPRPLVTD